MPALAKLAAQIRYERKQAEKYALVNTRLEDEHAAFLGNAYRELVELCDSKIERLRLIQEIFRICNRKPSS